jgi:hypothetical protein
LKCHSVKYCARDCQLADWGLTHKVIYAAVEWAWEQLLQVCETGDEAKVMQLLVDGADANAFRIGSGMAPLHAAAYIRSVACVTALIEHGANVNAIDSAGQAPLHYAAADGAVGVAEVLLKAGANIHIIDDNGETALDLNEFSPLVRLLTAAGGRAGTKVAADMNRNKKNKKKASQLQKKASQQRQQQQPHPDGEREQAADTQGPLPPSVAAPAHTTAGIEVAGMKLFATELEGVSSDTGAAVSSPPPT